MIRPYIHDEDEDKIYEMLSCEGFSFEDMGFIQHKTYVLYNDGIKGFFTYRMEHGLPYIIHFCTHKDYRSISLARDLMKGLRDTLRDKGYVKAIFQMPLCNQRASTMLSYYFKKHYYATENNYSFMLTEV